MKNHPFFEAIEMACKIEKKAKCWGVGNAQKNLFFRALEKSHPFVFDKKVTFEKRMEGRTLVNFKNIVEDFSLPFRTSLYLLTDAPTYHGPVDDKRGEKAYSTMLGYLIDEITPERFAIFTVGWGQLELDGKKVPWINQFQLDLTAIDRMNTFVSALQSMNDKESAIAERKPEAHVFKETGVVLELSRSISVKRVGIEHLKSFSMKSGIGTGYTSVKTPNLYHVADKEEYEYAKSLDKGKINWEWIGFWRGHWRAFYCYADGKKVKDQFARNVVDYNKIGKNRAGEYNVPGYTWVTEHTRGDPAIAEIKTHYVVKK